MLCRMHHTSCRTLDAGTKGATPMQPGFSVNLSKRYQVQLRGHSWELSQVCQHALCLPTQGKQSCGRAASPRLCTAAELQADLEAHPDIAGSMQDEGFGFMVRSHMLLHDIVSAHICLDRAVTKVSDDRGVFLRTGHLPPEVKAPGRPGQPPLLRVQTLQSCSPSPGQGSGSLSCVVDWAHHTFALSPFYCYSKSSVFTADNDLVPHLELEMGVVPGTPEVLFYLSMDPNAPTMVTQGKSLAGTSTNSISRGNTSRGVTSWSTIETRAASCPGFVRFTSPDFHVRAFSSTAILFKVDAAGWASALDVLSDGVNTWLSWAQEDQHSESLRGDDIRSTAQPTQALGDAQAMTSRSWAWRTFPRRERAAELMKGIFGKPVMEDYWDSMAGDPRIRH